MMANAQKCFESKRVRRNDADSSNLAKYIKKDPALPDLVIHR